MQRAFAMLSTGGTLVQKAEQFFFLFFYPILHSLFAPNMSCNVRFLVSYIVDRIFFFFLMSEQWWLGMNLIWYHLNEWQASWNDQKVLNVSDGLTDGGLIVERKSIKSKSTGRGRREEEKKKSARWHGRYRSATRWRMNSTVRNKSILWQKMTK